MRLEVFFYIKDHDGKKTLKKSISRVLGNYVAES